MSPREERAIRNEEIFREVNGHIAKLEERMRDVHFDEPLHLVCECSITGCAAPLEVDLATFEQVRSEPLRFFVTPGHEDLEVESVVEERPGYLVVEKHVSGAV
jgi:hypothetical protein